MIINVIIIIIGIKYFLHNGFFCLSVLLYKKSLILKIIIIIN